MSKKCPKCGNEYPEDNNYCETCAVPLITENPTEWEFPVQSENPQAIQPEATVKRSVTKKNEKLGCIIIIIFLIILFFIIFSVFKSCTEKKVTNATVLGCAESLINEQLKAPASANYTNGKVISKDKYGKYLVYMEVDAQNSFGAYLHSEYIVILRSVNPDGEYTYSPDFSLQEVGDSDISTVESSLESMNNWNQPINSSSN